MGEAKIAEPNQQIEKFKEIYEKLTGENEKLAKIRDDFQKLKDMFFDQLDEKMQAMDRSLLEKLAADIEIMDKEEGMSPDEFDRFLARVPKHLKEKFNKIATDFKKFDTND